jgi:hypothetical protein
MRFWIVKGKPSRNDLDEMLRPGRTEAWVTRKPPIRWAVGDGVFFWKSAPALHVAGLGRIERLRGNDRSGETWFDVRYLTGPLEKRLSLDVLRADEIIGSASFLKAGAAGTVFPLTTAQAERLLTRIRGVNPALRDFSWQGGASAPNPTRALSVRQPWAELILRGQKTIEVRSRLTNIRDRVHIYASLGDVDAASKAHVEREYGVDIATLPRGVLVGTVAIVDCRRLTVQDSHAAAFPVSESGQDYAWLLASPERAMELVKPEKHPQPVFFNPF